MFQIMVMVADGNCFFPSWPNSCQAILNETFNIEYASILQYFCRKMCQAYNYGFIVDSNNLSAKLETILCIVIVLKSVATKVQD